MTVESFRATVRRTLQVTRIQLFSWPSAVGWPWTVLLIVLVINLMFFAAVGAQGDGQPAIGGLLPIYLFVLVAYVQTMTQGFPFLLGLSVTRTEFFAGTSLFVLAQSFAFAILLYLFKLLEDATNGWGMSLRFFGFEAISAGNGPQQVLVYAMPFCLVAFIGIGCGSVFKRWGATGLYTVAISTAAVVGAVAAVVALQDSWVAFGDWFAGQSAVGLFAGWPAVLTLALAVASFVVLRRASP